MWGFDPGEQTQSSTCHQVSPFSMNIYWAPTVYQVPPPGAEKHNEQDTHTAQVIFWQQGRELRKCMCRPEFCPPMLGNGYCRVSFWPLEPLGLQSRCCYQSILTRETPGRGGTQASSDNSLKPGKPNQAGSWEGPAEATQLLISLLFHMPKRWAETSLK